MSPQTPGSAKPSQASSSTAATSSAGPSSSNRAMRRQQARKKDKGKARSYGEDKPQNDTMQKPDEQVKKKKASSEDLTFGGDATRALDYWGFLPGDYPLSDTDDEAGDPVKEREERVLRARKRQLHLLLCNAFEEEQRYDWAETFAQARMLEIKWMDDDLAQAKQQAERKGTAWIKEIPGKGRWLSTSTKALEGIQERYAETVKEAVKKDGNTYSCGDRFKVLMLTRAWMTESMRLMPEALQGMLNDSDEEDDGEEGGGKKGKVKKEAKVLGFEYIEGPEGVPCLGVKLRKKTVEQRDMAELLASRVSSLFYDGPPQQSRR